MKPTDFRIGNYVESEYGDEIIEAITWRFVTLEDAYEGTTYESIKPIPLTEEWLERFGFEDRQIRAGSCMMKIEYHDLGGGQYAWYFDKFKFVGLDYVHQLQNLYFALTGEELTIKEI